MASVPMVDFVTLDSVGQVKISTVQLPGGIHGSGYETCLFWRDGSRVKATHYNGTEATRSHQYWSRPEVVESVVRAVMLEQQKEGNQDDD
jgi:hypothetical protein